MSKYMFLALSSDGRECELAVEANDEASARRLLSRRGSTVIRRIDGRSSDRSIWKKRDKFDLYSFTGRLAPLLEADIQLEKALAVIEENAARGESEVIRAIRKGLHEGKSFSEVTGRLDHCFPPFYTGLLASGEEAGCMADVVVELRRFLRESKEFKDFIFTSSIYPAVILSVTLGVIILLFTVFVPRFAKIFEELGKELPTLTAAMLHIGNFMQNIWFVWPLLIAAAILAVRRCSRDERFQEARDRLILRTPLLAKIVESLQVGRFLRTLSIMVKNHVHLLTAVKISKRVIGSLPIRRSFAEVEEKLRGGERLSDALATSCYLSGGALAMLRVAEESGEQGEMLERIASELEDETRLKIKRLLALMEPAVILFLACVVLLVVLAIFMAIMEMNVIK